VVYTPRKKNELRDSLEPLVRGLGMALVDFSMSKHKEGRSSERSLTRVALTVARSDGLDVGHDDCARVHHAVTPRLDLYFGEDDFSVEVSSPGIGRLLKDGNEFPAFVGREIKVYLPELQDWKVGRLQASDSEGITFAGERLPFARIGKAKLIDNESWGGV
jgi:ribosome maturation factor RimP